MEMKNSKGLITKKESERRPRSPATHRDSLENFVGEEAPEAGTSPSLGINSEPRNREGVRRPERPPKPYRTDNHEMEH